MARLGNTRSWIAWRRMAHLAAALELLARASPTAADARDQVTDLAHVVYTALEGHTRSFNPGQRRNVSVLIEAAASHGLSDQR